MPFYKSLIAIAAIFLAGMVSHTSAAESSDVTPAIIKQEGSSEENPSTSVPTLKQVTVVGQAEDLLTGKSEMAGDNLQQLPRKNDNINEIINVLPRVQFGEEQRTSENAGEILPPLISISGGRPYESYYSVDGVGINSLIDPLANNQNAIDQVPGHPQRVFIHPDLIDSVTVYDHNIPAKYGRFVGGVVDAKTRMPAETLGGNVNLRTTRDSWTQFHIEDENKDEFYDSNTFSQQPRFKKYDGGFELDVPVNDESGLLGSYKRIQSNLELKEFGDWKTKKKILETYFLKYAWTPPTPYTLTMTGSYTPSREDFFITDTEGSDFTVKRGGYTLNGMLSGDIEVGSYELSAAYIGSRNKREAPADFYTWRNTPSKDWGEEAGITRSREGGFGDLDNTEQSIQLQAELVSNPYMTGRASHVFSLGAEYDWDYGRYDRKDTTYVHNTATLSSTVVCAPDDPACVDGEQYFGSRNVYSAQDEHAHVNYFAAYLEDRIGLGPVELRPGLRIDHNDFTDDTNFAHRLAGSWDVLQDGRTVLIGGYNRYYGGTLLTYKLREAILPYYKDVRSLDPVTNELSAWTFDGVSSATLDKYSDLDTPYSDEWTIGIAQQVFGGTLKLNYVERRDKDQFAKEKITETVGGETRSYYILNNNGSSKYQSVVVEWERQWLKHYLNVNYTYSKQDASNESYDDLVDVAALDEQVWYNGDLIDRSDLPRRDYNRSHRLNIIYIGKLPHGFTFTNVTRYLGSYDSIAVLSTSEKTARGIPTDVTAYEDFKRPDYWVFDWRLDWEKETYRDQKLTISLELDNVFGRTPPSGALEDTYELGRQFWLGMTYSF